MGLFRSVVERRSVPMGAQWGTWPGDQVQGTWSGANVTSASSMQLLTVYGCVRLIADSIATLPLDAYIEENGVSLKQPDEPLWLEQPMAGLDRVAWLTQILVSLLLDGNAYIAVILDDVGRILSLEPLDPLTVSVQREQSMLVYYVNGQPSRMQILHVRGLMRPGALVGMSPVEAARQSIGVGMSTQEFAAKFFDQGATMSGVIEVPGELTPTMARDMAKQWSRFHGGSKKAHLPGVLQGGATWKTTGVTNDQAQFLETRKFTAAEIAGQMFLLDPTDLGIGVDGASITYANLEQRNARRVQVTFLPWLIRIEHALSSILTEGEYIKFNVEGLLRGDTKTRYETYKIGRDIGVLELSEIRAWEELPPLPDVPAAPPKLVDQIDAVGQLIRAGFDPESALQFLGLPSIKHTGLVPITVTEQKP